MRDRHPGALYPREVRERARKLRAEGLKLWAIENLLGPHERTIRRWTVDLPRPENRQGRRRADEVSA
jgi:hypothetical protein